MSNCSETRYLSSFFSFSSFSLQIPNNFKAHQCLHKNSIILFLYALNNFFKKERFSKRKYVNWFNFGNYTLFILVFLPQNHTKWVSWMHQPTTVHNTLEINIEKNLLHTWLKSTQLASNRTQSKMISLSPLTTLQSSSILNSI